MEKRIQNHYLKFSQYTYPGLYRLALSGLPADISSLCRLVRAQIVHPMAIKRGLEKVSWERQKQDDALPTASAMLAELFRMGFFKPRRRNKLILTCRFISVLIASILKSRRIPARVRSGFAPYFTFLGDKSVDHWITEYWNGKRWVRLDVDAFGLELGFDPLDVPAGKFDYPADAWLAVRSGQQPGEHYWNACGMAGLKVIAWELFYDFHCLMNDEVIYLHIPKFIRVGFDTFTEKDLREIDMLARLMQQPDKNFGKLCNLWETKRKFRIMKGGLI